MQIKSVVKYWVETGKVLQVEMQKINDCFSCNFRVIFNCDYALHVRDSIDHLGCNINYMSTAYYDVTVNNIRVIKFSKWLSK